jgi:hypothetical protein
VFLTLKNDCNLFVFSSLQLDVSVPKPKVTSSNLVGRNTEAIENKSVTIDDKLSTESEKQNLVSGLFSAQELLDRLTA